MKGGLGLGLGPVLVKASVARQILTVTPVA